MAKFVDRLTSP